MANDDDHQTSKTRSPCDGSNAKFHACDHGFRATNLRNQRETELKFASFQKLDAPIQGKAESVHKEVPSGEDAPFKFAGILGCLLSTFFFSVGKLCIKMLPNSHTIEEKVKVTWFRGFFLTLICAAAIVYQKSTFKVKRDEILMNFIRTFFGYLGVLGIFLSLQYITVGESTALIYASPVWTTILSYFLLHEPFPITLVVVLPVGFLGILMIAKPNLLFGTVLVTGELQTRNQYPSMTNASMVSEKNQTSAPETAIDQLADEIKSLERWTSALISNTSFQPSAQFQSNATELDSKTEFELYLQTRWPGVLIALATSLILSLALITLKFRRTTPIQTVTFYFGLGTILVTPIIQCFIGFGTFPSTLLEWSILFFMGLSSWLGHALLQWALQYEKTSVLSIVRTTDVVMAFCWSTIFLNENVLWTSALGATIIVLVVVLLILNNHVEKCLCTKCRQRSNPSTWRN